MPGPSATVSTKLRSMPLVSVSSRVTTDGAIASEIGSLIGSCAPSALLVRRASSSREAVELAPALLDAVHLASELLLDDEQRTAVVRRGVAHAAHLHFPCAMAWPKPASGTQVSHLRQPSGHDGRAQPRLQGTIGWAFLGEREAPASRWARVRLSAEGPARASGPPSASGSAGPGRRAGRPVRGRARGPPWRSRTGGTRRSGAARPPRRSPRPRATAPRARAGSRGWARAPTAPGPGRASRSGAARRARGGSRCGRTRTPRRPGRRPRASSASTAQASEDVGWAAATWSGATPSSSGRVAGSSGRCVGGMPSRSELTVPLASVPGRVGPPVEVGAVRPGGCPPSAGSRRPRRRGPPCRPRPPCPRRAGRTASCCRPRRRSSARRCSA